MISSKKTTDRLLAGLFLLSILIFLFNARSEKYFGDFAPVYASARCIVLGLNPYSLPDAQAQLLASGGDTQVFNAAYWHDYPLAYPPTTYYLISPFAWMPYPLACKFWFLLSAAILVAACIATVRLSPLPSRKFAICGVSAILATSSVLLRLGQLSAPVIGLVVLASLFFLNNRSRLTASCLFLLAAALKPQLAVPLLIYFFFPRQTRKYALAVLGILFVLSVFFGVLLAHNPRAAHWPSDLIRTLHNSSTLSAAPTQRLDTGIINLDTLTALISPNPLVYGMLSITLISILVVVLAVGLHRLRNNPICGWLGVATVSLLTLIIAYHRTYDMRMILLTIPALRILWRVAPRMAALLTLLSCFLLFSTAILLLHILSPHLSDSTMHGVVFRLLVERQQALFVFLTTTLWVFVSFRASRYNFSLSDKPQGASQIS